MTSSSAVVLPDGEVVNSSYNPLSNQNGAEMSIPSATARRIPITGDGSGNGAGEMGMGMSTNSHYGQHGDGEMYNRDNIFPYVNENENDDV